VNALDDFDAFYRAHVRDVLAFFVRRTGRGELAADLTAETFAAALASRDRFDPARGTPNQWLYGIARHQLQHALERGRADDRLRRRLGIHTPAVDDETLAAIERLNSRDAENALEALPPAYRQAVHARIVEERPYGEIARTQNTNTALARQRVSRGLAALRRRLEQERSR
jgi:RNA polymerase sigma-70 factor (ECF subfamily)